MINRTATLRVGQVAHDEFDINKEVVSPLIVYANDTFPDPEERMRFMAMVTISTLIQDGETPLDKITTLLPEALLDILERIVEQEPAPTVH